MSRPPHTPTPRWSFDHAVQAAEQIRVLRAEANDADLGGFPTRVVDDADVDAVVDYCEQHRHVSRIVRAAETPHRAVLVEYQHQRDVARHEARVLAVLRTGHELAVPPRAYGPQLGLPTRYAVYLRRRRLEAKVSDGTRRTAASDARARRWLDEHAAELRAAGDLLTDRRDELLILVDDGPARRELAAAIDDVGVEMNSRRPSERFAGAIAYALHLLRPRGPARRPDDPALEEQIERGLRLLW